MSQTNTLVPMRMRTYLSGGILLLPVLALFLVWNRLPATVVIHSAGADKWVSRSDFAGLVVAVTGICALFAYGLLQLQRAFQPIDPRQVDKAYVMIASGVALIGLLLVGAGLLSP